MLRQTLTYVSLLMALSTTLVVVFKLADAYAFEVEIAVVFAVLAWTSACWS